MYRECFKLMDINKDGTIDKNDLRGAFDNVGVLMTEGELDELLGEIGGPCNYDNMVKMFQEKMAGGKSGPGINNHDSARERVRSVYKIPANTFKKLQNFIL